MTREVRRPLAGALALAWLAGAGAAARAEEPGLAPARVGLELRGRGDAFGGAAFGVAGVYERLDAAARVALDPAHPANAGIADLALAPRAADGSVAYETDVVILRPKDAARGNRVLLHEVVNRGNRLALSVLNDAPRGAGLGDAAGGGKGFLMRRGFTLVWVGWQADVSGPDLLSARLPVASEGGAPITGRVQVEQVFDHAENPARLALPYAAASRDPAQAELRVRHRQGDVPRVLPASALRYVDERNVEIERPAGFDAGAIRAGTFLKKLRRSPTGLS